MSVCAKFQLPSPRLSRSGLKVPGGVVVGCGGGVEAHFSVQLKPKPS